MTGRGLRFACLMMALAVWSLPASAADGSPPVPAFAGQTGAPAPPVASHVSVTVVLEDLTFPRALAVLPDGRMLLGEATGRVRLLDADGGVLATLEGVPDVRSMRSSGLNDLIVDPEFADNRRVYLSYLAPPEGEPAGETTRAQQAEWRQRVAEGSETRPWAEERIASARLSADGRRLQDLRVLRDVAGRRLVYARGMLYTTTTAALDNRGDAQRADSLNGKVLRIAADGSVPEDNPYATDDDARPEVFSLGHRDPDGAALHPETGELWTVEHGPMGGDELNVIRAGRNYGWPVITYGREYSGAPVGEGVTAHDGLEQPRYFWNPSIAPAGLMFYTGDMFPAWRGNLFVGAMVQRHLVRLELDGERVTAEEQLLLERERRVRTVAQGADGALYVLTDSEEDADTGAAIPGEMLRLTPR